MRGKLGRALAWAVTAAALAYLFWKTPVTEVWAAMGRAAPWTVPAVIAAVLTIFVADVFAMWRTFGWFLAALPFRDVLVVRGATYLLAAINYSVGQGAIVYFVHRARGVPVMRGVATVLLIMGTNLLVLLSLVTAAMLLVGGPRPPALPLVVGVAWAGLAVYAALVAIRPRVLASRPVFDVLLAAGLRGHLKTMAVRVPHVMALVGFNLILLYGFGARVPLGTALMALPVAMFIAVLPISVQGLGTTQAAMVLFFAPFVPAAAGDGRAVVLGASLAGQGMALACQVVIGVICLRSRLARGLGEAAKAAQREAASASSSSSSSSSSS